jgi:hypothetical protein
MQEQISIEVALNKTTAQLPEELISLIIEVPTLSATNGTIWKSCMPLSLRGYLFSWGLVFDHFSGSVSGLPPVVSSLLARNVRNNLLTDKK